MLLRAPSAEECLMSTRQKMDSRFAEFFAGHFAGLIQEIHSLASEHTNNKISEHPEHTLSTLKFRRKEPFAELNLLLNMD